jgi:hypothetical protein
LTPRFVWCIARYSGVPLGIDMHILHYHHKHGDDITVYETERAALLSAAGIIVEFLMDTVGTPERRQEIVSLIEAGELAQALESWHLEVSEEISIFSANEPYSEEMWEDSLEKSLSRYHEYEEEEEDD